MEMASKHLRFITATLTAIDAAKRGISSHLEGN
jgi:hypothetical protein